jgi:hypothetical protein
MHNNIAPAKNATSGGAAAVVVAFALETSRAPSAHN